MPVLLKNAKDTQDESSAEISAESEVVPMHSYSCPYCNYHITSDNVLFRYNTRKLPYRDMRRYAFYSLCSSNWPLESERFEGLYFLASDAENGEVVKDENDFPVCIKAKPCNGKTPTELEKMELPGDPLSNYIAQYENKNPHSVRNDDAAQVSSPTDLLAGTPFGMPSAAQTGDADAEIKPVDDGTVVAIAIRACPNCHNELHQRFGRIPTINVTLLGGPSAGKTAYLLSLTHQLAVQLAGHGLGTATLLNASAQYFKFLDQGYQVMKTTMPTVRDEKLFPFVFHYENWQTQKECFVKFFDIAGETTNDPNALLNHQGIMEASTLLLILDPNQLNQGMYSAALNAGGAADESMNRSNVECFEDDISSFIGTSIINNTGLGAFQNIKHIIAVFSKMDMVLQADRKFFGAGQDNVNCIVRYDLGKAHTGGLDTAVIRKIGSELDRIINHVSDRPGLNLRSQLCRIFRGIKEEDTLLLGVSTHTLVDPSNIVFENDCSSRASKHRIIEPFLCILAQNDMIPKYNMVPVNDATPKNSVIPRKQMQTNKKSRFR